MAKLDISIELVKIDSQITEARKAGNRIKVAELRLKHKEFSILRARGIETIKGDKRKARKDQEGEISSGENESQTTIDSSQN